MNQNELTFILRMRDEASRILRQLGSAFGDAGDKADDLKDSGDKANESLNKIVKAAKEAAVAVGGIWASSKGLQETTDAWGKYQLGLIGVAKTTNMSGAELDKFRQNFDRLNASMNGLKTENLQEIASMAGQMGVSNDALLDYVETMGKLNVATDVVGGDGAKSISRILGLTREGDKAVKQFGDSLVYLGNSTKASEQEMLTLATQLAQTTSEFHLTSDSILALSAASKEFGLPDDLTASSAGRVLRSLRDGSAQATQGFDNFLAVANLTKQEFDQMLKEHPEQVLIRFGQAYQAVTAKGGGGGLLSGLGLDTDEVKRVFGVVGEQAETFQRKLADLQSGAQKNAADKEAKQFFDAQKNQIEGLAKAWEQVKVAVGEALAPLVGPVVGILTNALNHLAAGFKSLPDVIKTVLAAIVTLGPAVYGVIRAVRLLKLAFAEAAGSGGVAALVAGSKGAAAKAGAEAGTAAGAAAGAGLLGSLGKIIKGALWLDLAYEGGRILGEGMADALVKYAPNTAKAMNDWFTNTSVGRWFSGAPAPQPQQAQQGQQQGGKNSGPRGNAAGEVKKPVNSIRLLTDDEKSLLQSIDSQFEARQKITQQEKLLATLRKLSPDELKRNNLTGEQLSRLERTVELQKRQLDPMFQVTRGLKDELDNARAITGEQKNSVEINQRIRDIVEQTGESYATVNARVRATIVAIQAARKAAAVTNAVQGINDQIAQTAAITAEEKGRVAILQQINQLERENGKLTADQKKLIAERMRALQLLQKSVAYSDAVRGLNDQLAAARAVTFEERTQVEVVKTIVDFERQYGRLTEQQRKVLAERTVLLRTIAEYQRMESQYDPVGVARRQYAEEARTLEVMRQKGVIQQDQYERMKQNLDERTRSQRDPVGDRVKNLREELAIMRLSTDKQEIERQVLQEVNSLKQQGVVVTDKMTEAVREYVVALNDAEKAKKNGLGGFVNEVGPLKDALAGLQKDFASGLSDAISGSLNGNKGSFTNFLNDLGKKMVKVGIDQLMSETLKKLGVQNPEQKAINRADEALKKLDALGQAGIKTPQAIITAGTVTINGKELSNAVQAANDNAPKVEVSKAARDALAGMPDLAGGGSGGGGGGGGGRQKTSGAVDLAMGLLNKNEVRDRSSINSFLRAGGVNIDAARTKWCAAFVNSSLKQIGVTGTGRLNANSFLEWGKKVKPGDVMKGDVLVESNGKGADEAGGHVGFATGRSRQGKNGLELEMLSGNSSNSVQKTWESADRVQVRRATEAMGNAQAAKVDTSQVQQATQQLQQSGQQVSQSMQTASASMQNASTATQQLDQATQQTGVTAQTAGVQVQTSTSQASTAMNQLDTATQQTGTNAQTAGSQFQQAGTQIQQAGEQAAAGGQAAAAGGNGFSGLTGALQSTGQQAGAAQTGLSSFSGAMGGLSMLFSQLGGMLGGAIGGKTGRAIGSTIGSFLPMLFLAEGGKVRGPGSGTSDSIPAFLSHGEFIVNAEQTRKFGPVLEAINQDKLPHFSIGGVVSKLLGADTLKGGFAGALAKGELPGPLGLLFGKKKGKSDDGITDIFKGLFGGLGHLFADGGQPKGDMLAMVSHGEFRVAPKQAAKYGPVLKAINDNKMPRFSTGGFVGSNVVDLRRGESALKSGRAPSSQSEEVADLAQQVSTLSRSLTKAGFGGRTNNNSVNMTVYAKDADSFRRSQGQQLADAQLKMNRFGSRNN